MPKRKFNNDFDQWIDDLDRDSHRLVFHRACAQVGWERDLDGSLFLVDGDVYSEEFMDALDEQYKKMYTGDLLEMLTAQGRLKPDRVDENGEIIYVEA